MKNTYYCILSHVFLFTVLFSGFSRAEAAPWQEGYVVFENSQSPDGRYGLLIPGRDMSVPERNLASPSYLINLKLHRSLGEIRGVTYTQGENHRGLLVLWDTTSKWCVVEDEARFGFYSIAVLTVKGMSFSQTNIGESIQNSLNSMVAKESGNPEQMCYGTVFYRFSSDQKLRVRAIATTNAKRISGVKSFFALFQGTFDLVAGKWSVTDAHSVTESEYDALLATYDELWNKNAFFPEGGLAEALDRQMNFVYSALRMILSPERFSEIKREQIAWLKKLAAERSTTKKCKLLEARIKVLQDLAWKK